MLPCMQALALALYSDYRAPARAADAAEGRRLQAAFSAKVRSVQSRFEEGALIQAVTADGAGAAADGGADAAMQSMGCAVLPLSFVEASTGVVTYR